MNEIIKKLVYSEEITVRWRDMDDFGHVNNSVYLTYFESARIGWWRRISPPQETWDKFGPVIINATCTFLKPIVYPETIIVDLSVSPPGRSSYECFYEIKTKDGSLLYANGSTKVVWVDRMAGKSMPLPSYILNHLPTA